MDLPPETDPTDPLFQHQWYLKNTGQNGGKPKLDLNVAAAWAQGVTGKNITTAIMDDGVDYMHPDLINNYVSVSVRRFRLSSFFVKIGLFERLSSYGIKSSTHVRKPTYGSNE